MKTINRIPWVWKWAIGLQLVLALPYLLGLLLAPPGARFGGFIYNPDDPYVYLSWMRQAAGGHLLFRNLFTLEPQKGVSFQLLFCVLGAAARVIHLPLVVVYHLARMGLGLCFVLEIFALARLLVPNEKHQAWLVALVTTGSGLGWLFFAFDLMTEPSASRMPLLGTGDLTHFPTDLWMTETVPFLSLLLNPLFLCGLCLLLGAFLCLLRAEETSSLRWSLYAGLCALLLGNIHSYDILVLHPVWILFLGVLTLRPAWARARWSGWKPGPAWIRYGVMFLVGLPTVIYQYWVLQVEPVFQARANVPTLSPPFIYYLVGVGAAIPLAMFAARRASKDPVLLWLAVWCAAGLALPYAMTPAGPLSFQRKLAIGLDLPFLALGGVWLSGQLAVWGERGSQTGRLAAGALASLLALSNIAFVGAYLFLLAGNVSHVIAPLYLDNREAAALTWLRIHHQPGDTVLCYPWLGNVIPAETGDAVYVGHWGETMDFGIKLNRAAAFYQHKMPVPDALQFLRDQHIRYVFSGLAEQELLTAVSPDSAAGSQADWLSHLPGLTKVFEEANPGSAVVVVYRVD